jgi:hypothetical protein
MEAHTAISKDLLSSIIQLKKLQDGGKDREELSDEERRHFLRARKKEQVAQIPLDVLLEDYVYRLNSEKDV